MFNITFKSLRFQKGTKKHGFPIVSPGHVWGNKSNKKMRFYSTWSSLLRFSHEIIPQNNLINNFWSPSWVSRVDGIIGILETCMFECPLPQLDTCISSSSSLSHSSYPCTSLCTRHIMIKFIYIHSHLIFSPNHFKTL